MWQPRTALTWRKSISLYAGGITIVIMKASTRWETQVRGRVAHKESSRPTAARYIRPVVSMTTAAMASSRAKSSTVNPLCMKWEIRRNAKDMLWAEKRWRRKVNLKRVNT
jgi:hypothetical protein